MINATTDVRRERRALSDDELLRLVESAEKSAGVFRGLGGRDRAMLYLTAAFTGLRANELASLSEESFALDADPPTVTVEAGYSKHRRRDLLPLHPALACRLREWLTEREIDQTDEPAVLPMRKASAARLWPGSWPQRSADMFRDDLAAAHARWLKDARRDAERQERERSGFLRDVDAQGRVADFHALRHTFITRLAQSGVHPKVAKELARHSTITLTMDRYAHVGLVDMTAGLDALPALAASREAAAATGTDDAAADTGRPVNVPRRDSGEGESSREKMVAEMVAAPGDKNCDSLTAIETHANAAESDAGTSEAPAVTRIASDCASMKKERRRPDSNRGWRICNPLP